MKYQRISLVIFVKGDRHVAEQICDGVKAFIKANFKVEEDCIQTGIRTPLQRGEKNERG